MTRTPIDWTFDGHPIYPPDPDLPLPQFHAESTITLAFGFAPDTQTGAVERWAAGDPASVVEHLPTHRPSGSQCIQCVSRASDCSGLDFAAMRPAGRPDPDGVQRVACTGYRRGDALPTLAQISDRLGPLADAEVLGIVKPRPGAAARARLESTQQGRDLMAQNRPCRCGPDGCSASDCAGKA